MYACGDILSHTEMCLTEGLSLQKGMNFRRKTGSSVILMSRRRDAPYLDSIDSTGRVLVYEGHDAPGKGKLQDQPELTPGGKLTENGLFFRAAKEFQTGRSDPEFVKVYEKLHRGIWVFNGLFKLVDAWTEPSGNRRVFKFRLELLEYPANPTATPDDLRHDRVIPSAVKLEVWRRDGGKCVRCRRADNLHFDHILPFSLGGTSLLAENIQLLCARHNLEKKDKIDGD